MGKSTILNLLVKDAGQRTQEYSVALNLGKQTTTAARWFNYEGGAIVDSPGFQEFGLSHLTLNDIMRGMPEIRDRVEKIISMTFRRRKPAIFFENLFRTLIRIMIVYTCG